MKGKVLAALFTASRLFAGPDCDPSKGTDVPRAVALAQIRSGEGVVWGTKSLYFRNNCDKSVLPHVSELPETGSYQRAVQAGQITPNRYVSEAEAKARFDRVMARYDRASEKKLLSRIRRRIVRPPRTAVEAIDAVVSAPSWLTGSTKLKGNMVVHEAYVTANRGTLELHVSYEDDDTGVFISLYKKVNGKMQPVKYEYISHSEFALRDGERVEVFSIVDTETKREFISRYKMPSLDDKLVVMLTDIKGNSDYVSVERR